MITIYWMNTALYMDTKSHSFPFFSLILYYHNTTHSFILIFFCLHTHLFIHYMHVNMWELDVIRTLAALINSSAKHSAIVLMLRNAASRAPVHNNQMAWLTRLSGETSTAWRRTVPARPIRVESSRGPELIMADTRI